MTMHTPSPSPDGTLPGDETHLHGIDSLFSPQWARHFLTAWNSSDACDEMVDAGEVFFVSADPTGNAAVQLRLFWDSDGKASLSDSKMQEEVPAFTAQPDVWRALIKGESEPIRAVATGELVYRGPTRFPLQFIDGFRSVFAVAAAMPESAGNNRRNV